MMSIKQKRLGMLASLNNSLRDIEADAENQTVEILQSNMKTMQEWVKDILALDGVDPMRSDSPVKQRWVNMSVIEDIENDTPEDAAITKCDE